MEGWDSLAVVSLIAMVDEQAGLTLAPKEIAKAATVADLIGLLGGKIDA
jgi:acyl carrier protein